MNNHQEFHRINTDKVDLSFSQLLLVYLSTEVFTIFYSRPTYTVKKRS
jgi:hypothetical protein